MQATALLNGQEVIVIEAIYIPCTNTSEALIAVGNSISWIRMEYLSQVVWVFQ